VEQYRDAVKYPVCRPGLRRSRFTIFAVLTIAIALGANAASSAWDGAAQAHRHPNRSASAVVGKAAGLGAQRISAANVHRLGQAERSSKRGGEHRPHMVSPERRS